MLPPPRESRSGHKCPQSKPAGTPCDLRHESGRRPRDLAGKLELSLSAGDSEATPPARGIRGPSAADEEAGWPLSICQAWPVPSLAPFKTASGRRRMNRLHAACSGRRTMATPPTPALHWSPPEQTGANSSRGVRRFENRELTPINANWRIRAGTRQSMACDATA